MAGKGRVKSWSYRQRIAFRNQKEFFRWSVHRIVRRAESMGRGDAAHQMLSETWSLYRSKVRRMRTGGRPGFRQMVD